MTTVQTILDALKRLAGSMKAWTMLLGLITAIAAHCGFNVDPTIFWTIVGAFAALLGVQGATDWGKTAATIAATQTPMTSMLSAVKAPSARYIITKPATGKVSLVLDNGEEHDLTDILAGAGYVRAQIDLPVNKQAGFAALWLMVLLTVGLAAGIGVVLASCTTGQKTAINDVKSGAIACSKTDFLAQIIPVATVLLAHPSDTVAQLDSIGLQAGEDVLACAIKTALDVLTAGATKAAPSEAVVAGRSYIAAHNFHFVGE